jgi:undecaprenyl-diphosphatase
VLLESFILGAVQGITELLPISSSAHLIIVPYLLGFRESALNTNLFDAILHGGSLAAIIAFFFRDIKKLLTDKRLTLMLCVSAIPTFIIGLAIEPFKDHVFRSLYMSAVSLVIFGIYMIIAEKRNRENRDADTLTFRDYLVLGLMQAVALIPGTSRSGITISSAFMMNLKKEKAIEISFLMSIPVVFVAFAYELRKAVALRDAVPMDVIAVGLLSSFVFGLLALFFLVKFVRSYKFSSFAYYRFFVAFVLLILLWKNR